MITFTEIAPIIVSYTPKQEKKKISSLFLGLGSVYRDVNIENYTLQIKYKDIDKILQIYSCRHSDSKLLDEIAKDVIKQVKKQDPKWIDEAFEQVFIKEN